MERRIDRCLALCRDWAEDRVASGSEPPWAWYQYMKLIETVAAIQTSRAAVSARDPHAADPQRVQAPAPEAPGRFVRQLHGLAAGLAVIHGRTSITLEDVERVERVAMDCLPPARRLIVEALRGADTLLTVAELEERTGRRISNKTIRRELEALKLLDVVGRQDGGYYLTQEL